ncbi:flippase-like domain-containing protein [Aquibacillus sp. 3ASR75-11]|uniref:Phosphatidylglycerol lysyltransferase n=1 Tax=Terrihalobacillus insolitus TaxID=2950438 RepID=A0A9X3WTC9_9BACI|nr:lysylphosphatidylglycerol synthase transmembrane domain-containing protein [Terrihalobacillus insolitus]MDC3425130.1 flippase-like domain-containing protein [Terrihalobacillus insolitus]
MGKTTIINKKSVTWTIKLSIFGFFVWLITQFFDLEQIVQYSATLIKRPWLPVIMTIAYTAAFFARAKAWQLFLRSNESLSKFLTAILYSLVVNHLSPVKAGDLIRVGFLVQKTNCKWADVLYSVVIMRMFDLLLLASFVVIGAVYYQFALSFKVFIVILVIISTLILGSFSFKKTRRIILHYLRVLMETMSSWKGVRIVLLITLSWILEAVIVFSIANVVGSGKELSFTEAVWVNSITIAGQTFQFSPGGIGTYESFMSYSLSVLRYSLKDGLTIAVVTHAYKFVYSFFVGMILLVTTPITFHQIKEWKKRKEQMNHDETSF